MGRGMPVEAIPQELEVLCKATAGPWAGTFLLTGYVEAREETSTSHGIGARSWGGGGQLIQVVVYEALEIKWSWPVSRCRRWWRCRGRVKDWGVVQGWVPG